MVLEPLFYINALLDLLFDLQQPYVYYDEASPLFKTAAEKLLLDMFHCKWPCHQLKNSMNLASRQCMLICARFTDAFELLFKEMLTFISQNQLGFLFRETGNEISRDKKCQMSRRFSEIPRNSNFSWKVLYPQIYVKNIDETFYP